MANTPDTKSMQKNGWHSETDAMLPGQKSIKNGWFSETDVMLPGQKFSLALQEFSEEKSILYNKHSEFQSILVFRSAQCGKK